YSRNKRQPEEYPPSSDDKVWWICPINPCGCHTYEASLSKRNIGRGCPYCRGLKTCKHSSLITLHPSISTEWDTVRNRSSPEEFNQWSNKEFWWVCPLNPCGCHKY